ncbi:MAG: hypothetical protein IPL71_11475 [Anaerolineales bacterium]|nr:hypothetical protein [Anaerolineales bacterium]
MYFTLLGGYPGQQAYIKASNTETEVTLVHPSMSLSRRYSGGWGFV